MPSRDSAGSVSATARLTFREFEKADWPAVHAYASDPEVVRYMPWGPNTEAESRDFVRRQIQPQSDDPRYDFEFAVIRSDDGCLIGGCGIHHSGPPKRRGHIGYCFRRDAWGHGYGTEAARALVAFGFEALDLHRIFATCDPQNTASARVLEKAGMRREGRLRDDMWIHGRWRDSFLYAILEHEWRVQP